MKVFYKHFFEKVETKSFKSGASIEEIINSNARCNPLFLDVFVSDKDKLHRIEPTHYKNVRPKKDVFIQAIPGLITSTTPKIREYEKDLVYSNVLPYTLSGAGTGAAIGAALTLPIGGAGGVIGGIFGGILGFATGLILGGNEFNAKVDKYTNDLKINTSEKLLFTIKSTQSFEELSRPESKQIEKELISNTVSRGSPVPEVFGTIRMKANRITPFEDTTTRSQREELTYFYEMVLSCGEGQLAISDLEMEEFTEDNRDEEKSFDTSYSYTTYEVFSGGEPAHQPQLESNIDVFNYENSVTDIPSSNTEGTIFLRTRFQFPIPPDPPVQPDKDDYPDPPTAPTDTTDNDALYTFSQEVEEFEQEVKEINQDFQDKVTAFNRDVSRFQEKQSELQNTISKVRSGANNLTALVTRSIKNPFLNNTTIDTSPDLSEQTGITGATLRTASYTVDGASFYGYYLGSDGSKIGSISPFSESIIQSISQPDVDNETITVTLQPSYAASNPDLAYIYIRENTLTDPTPTRFQLTKTSSNTYTFSVAPTLDYLFQSDFIFNLQFNDGTFLYSNPVQTETPDQDKINAYEINSDLSPTWSITISQNRFNDFFSNEDFLNGNPILTRQAYRDSGRTLTRSGFGGGYIDFVVQPTPNGLSTLEELGFAGDSSLKFDKSAGGEELEDENGKLVYDKLMVMKNSEGAIYDIYGVYSTGFFQGQQHYSFYSITEFLWFRDRYNFIPANETDTMTIEFYELGASFTAGSPVSSEDDLDELDSFFSLVSNRFVLEDTEDQPNIYSATSGFVRSVVQNATDLVIETEGEALDDAGMIDINGTEYAFTISTSGTTHTYTIDDTPLASYVSSQSLILRFKKSDNSYITHTRTATMTTPNIVTINRPSISAEPTDLSGNFLTTNNPAWICLYILKEWYDRSQFTLPFNQVVDIASFTEWGNYCSTNNLEFNGFFDFDTTVFDALSSIASVSRCQIVIGEDKIRAVIARAQSTIKQYFHARNIIDYSASLSVTRKPHALRGNFLNSDKGYFKDESTVYFEGFNESTAKDIQTISALGLVTKEEVDKHLNLVKLAVGKDLMVFDLVVSLEALVSRIGDFVGVNFDEVEESMFTSSFFGVTKNEGGLITGFQIDQKVNPDLDASSTYVCQFLKNDNTTTTPLTISSIERQKGSDNTLTDREGNVVTDEQGNPLTMEDRLRKTLVLETPISEDAFNNLGIEKGDLILFGKTNTVVKECLIKEVSINEDFTANLRLIEYDEELYGD